MVNVIIESNKEKVIEKLCDIIENASEEAIENRKMFTIGLSGGSLGSFLVTGLPKIKTDFSKWKIFFCDERLVKEDDPDSTFGFYKNNLIGAIGIKEEQFVKVKYNFAPQDAAEDYAKQIAQVFRSKSLPSFDMLLLGMGPDGHTCSLFPEHKLLDENVKWVSSLTDSPKPPPSRITLTFPIINNAKNCAFAVCGKEKADMVKRILLDKEDLPSGRVKPTSGQLYWILDEPAGVYIKTLH